MVLKLKYVQNLATLDVTTSSLETVTFDPREMVRNFRFEINRIL